MAAILCIIVTVLFSGCSGNNQGAQTDQPAGETQQPESARQVNLTWGASSSTSPFYAFYASLASGIQKANPNFNITIQETGGSDDNAKRVREGTCDIGSCSMESDLKSYNGTGAFEGEPCKDLRVLWYDHVSVYQWATAQSSNITDLTQFDGQYVSPGGAGTSQATVSKDVFELLGVHPKYLEGNQSVAGDAFQNRQIVGIAKLGPTPDSFLQQMQATQPINFINVTDEQYRKILTIYPAMQLVKVPAGAYENTGEWQSVGMLGGTQALSSLPQDAGYKLIKGLMEDARAEWEAAYPQGAATDILALTLQADTPLHAGTVQYLVEKEFDVPKELIPPEYKPA